jgi:hypothetical protein
MNGIAMVNEFLLGGTATACFVGGIFFLRFYRTTRDKLFLYFALALWVFAAHWTTLAFVGDWPKLQYLFFIRALAFLLLIVGIIQKNRG